MGLRDEILANRRLPVSPPIEIPGFSGISEPLHFRTLTAAEQDRLDDTAVKIGIPGMRALFAALVLGDKDGRRVFDDNDLPALDAMQGTAMTWIFDHGRKYNDIDTTGIERAEGNSPTPSADSGGA